MGGIQFDWTISLGSMIQLVVLVATIVGIYINLKERVISLETKVDMMYHWWKRQVEAR